MGTRAALYLRVSTTRQAEHDLSIPDQRRQAEAYCEGKGLAVVGEYVESGASGTTDRRPEFQRMIADACSPEHPFDAVIVYSLSRFARNALDVAIYEHKLEKHGVKLLSVSQEFTDDSNGKLLRSIIAAVDEKQSADTAEHTLRSMLENARGGYWNGSHAPFGYRTIEADRRRDKIKKRLEIDPKEAEIVRLVFGLYVRGDGRSGPIGIKQIVSHLNGRGLRNRQGNPFAIQFVWNMLRRTAYVGRHYFNTHNSHTRQPKKREEWIEIAVPSILDEETFDAAQRLLDSRNPKKTPPRRANNPVLLSSVARCGSCGSPMRLRTGKGGRYRYYTCGRCADQGKTACKGRTIPEHVLDGLVLDAFEERILHPDRLRHVIGSLVARASSTREKALEEVGGSERPSASAWTRSTRPSRRNPSLWTAACASASATSSSNGRKSSALPAWPSAGQTCLWRKSAGARWTGSLARFVPVCAMAP